MRTLPPYWDAYRGGLYDPSIAVKTGVTPDEIAAVTQAITSYPAGFHIHPKVKKLLEQRSEMGRRKARHRFRYGRSAGVRFAAAPGDAGTASADRIPSAAPSISDTPP